MRKLWNILDMDHGGEVDFSGTAEECMGWLWMSSEPFTNYSVEPADAPNYNNMAYMPDDPRKVR